MAVVIARVLDPVAAPAKVTRINVTGDTSYPTGGSALDLTQWTRGGKILKVEAGPAGGYVFEYLEATELLKAYWSGTAGAVLDEVANTTNMAGVTIPVTIWHR